MVALAGDERPLVADNRSEYSMATVHTHDTERTALLSSSSHEQPFTYGSLLTSPDKRKVLISSTLKMAAIFFISTAVLGATLWLALPTLEEYVFVVVSTWTVLHAFYSSDDRPYLKIPKTFAELQALNALLKKYRDIYPYRIVVCYVSTYLL